MAPLGVRRCLLLSDSHVAPLYARRAMDALRAAGIFLRLPGAARRGDHKRISYLEKVYDGLIQAGITRSDALVALGGGVIGDLGGFAAATYLRGGSSWSRRPPPCWPRWTAPWGGKTAVDLPAGKNLVGSFYQPHLVLIDPDTLSTLPPRELAGGDGGGHQVRRHLRRGPVALLTGREHLETGGAPVPGAEAGGW